MLLPWITPLLFASAASAGKPKGCNAPSFTTVTTTVPPTPTPTSTPSTTTTTTAITDVISNYPDSCTYRPTQTFYSSSGCALTCSTGFCVRDAAATVSCGCPTVFIETQTVTVCPTKTPCQQCYTGWGTFISTESCASATGTASASARPTAT